MTEKSVQNGQITLTVTSPSNDEEVIADQDANGNPSVVVEEEKRKGWGNKMEYMLATVGFAVGLGNVWRFPYLCQKNGGGAFLIPYILSLVVMGIPLFFMELAIGQSLRQGSVGVWNAIHPYLGGVGFASVVICLLVGIYYNMIIAWCFYYLFASFQDPLPYASCPMLDNVTFVEECHLAGRTQYYWYRNALDITTSIDESGGLLWHLCLVLLLAWILVFVCMMRGVESAGKAVYFTATFPYIVLIIFFGRGITLPGSGDGIKHMFTPQFDKLADPQVWLEAATQIFYSLGVAFGGLIAMSSYNDIHNNCRRDAILVSTINCGTSIFATIVIFSILGFKAHHSYHECLDIYAGNSTNVEKMCKDLEFWLSESAQGPGLTFIAFTEAIVKMPVSPLWAVLFFCMLLTLGLGSMFGTMEGALTPLYDLKLVPWRKEVLTAIISVSSFLIGLLFCQRSGEYWLQMFDSFTATIPVLFIGLSELIAVQYIYGGSKFEDDIEFMTGSRPGWYWRITWRFIAPVLVFGILIASIVNMGVKPIVYSAWHPELADVVPTQYPTWGYIVIVLLILVSCFFIPFIFVLRRFGFTSYEKKAQQPGQDNVIAPGAMTPQLSRVALNLSEEPLAGTDDFDSKYE
ncbi:hypothetical protein OS493_003743 [Desmophyllum pertusum]|uniref:Transporter n=1 Tax=Desmophyllum pertusum TaxID=174260 RepID=A0A9X0A767_9CNID|nr:hypothetical protein OS493_003743 [Desmophyllum pertusum]